MRFGTLPDGRPVTRFQLGAPGGVRASILDLGATVHELWAPDAHGEYANVVLGSPELSDYLREPPAYHGAVVGRFANRIGGASLPVDGRTHPLIANNGPHTLHGGPDGLHRRIWSVDHADESSIQLSLTSPDGDQGFPGTVTAGVRYTASGQDLRIELTAVTDGPTVVNLSQHAYFQLGGQGTGTIENHVLQVAADRYTPIDDGLIPTGELAAVDGTPFDLRRPRAVADGLGSDHEQIRLAGGYDHNLVLIGPTDQPAAMLTDPASGRTLTLFTDQPGLQVYSGNFLDGRPHPRRTGFALEPQVFPDAPHHAGEPGWPSATLRPGETYRHTILWRFGNREPGQADRAKVSPRRPAG